MKDARRLMQIHKDVGGTVQGRRYGLDVLNKSGIMFVASAWEAFVEEAAIQAIDHFLKEAKSHDDIPLVIRKATSQELEKHNNELKVLDLAGDGWRTVVTTYRDKVIKEEIATFNTPKPHNVDTLCRKLLGIRSVCEPYRCNANAVRLTERTVRQRYSVSEARKQNLTSGELLRNAVCT